jgi:hypothetical protein
MVAVPNFERGELSGRGSALINGGALQTVTNLYWMVDTITSPRVRVLDPASPKRLVYAGQIGCSYQYQDLRAGDIVPWTTFHINVNFDIVDMQGTFPPNGVYCDTLWWRLPSGIVLIAGVAYR